MQPDPSHPALHSKLSLVSSISHRTVRPDGIINKLLINSSHSHFTFKLPRLVSHFLKIILQRVASFLQQLAFCLCWNLMKVKLIILHCIRMLQCYNANPYEPELWPSEENLHMSQFFVASCIHVASDSSWGRHIEKNLQEESAFFPLLFLFLAG